MNDSKKILSAMIGDRGYEILEKAIYKQRTQAVVDPLEYYLPLIVVPRTIISWLVQTIKPMKTGEIKDVKFPGREDISIHFEKQDIDQYRAEFVSGGRVIHTFEKQSLPAASGHMMTVGELYNEFEETEQEAEEPLELDEPEEGVGSASNDSHLALQTMIDMANVKPSIDPEQVKWEMSHANVRELTAVIGKLVDSLTAKHLASGRLEAELDKVSEKEVEGDPQKRENAQTPEEKNKADIKATAANPAIDEKQQSIIEVRDNKAEPTQELAQQGPDPKVVKDEKHLQGVHTSGGFSGLKDKGQSQAGRNIERAREPQPNKYLRDLYHSRGVHAHGEKLKELRSMPKPNLPKSEMVMDKTEMPKGAGQPKAPQAPQAPKPPVPAGNAPAASAAKQAQSAGKGGYTPPKTPGAAMPKNPTAKPKAPAMAKGDSYFRGKLGKSEAKYSATEEQLYKSSCKECGKPEFVKGSDGKPDFQPCACFRVLKKDEEGQPVKFVQAIRKDDGTYNLQFDPKADPETIRIFLLTLKSRLLLNKRFRV